MPPSPEGGEGGRKDSGAPKDSAPDVIIDPENCVSPGSADYCSPGAGQCDRVGPGGSPEICTADLAGTPKHAWYCTLPCSKPSQCTGGATCVRTPMGSRCVPKSCDDRVPDAGEDSGDGESGAEGGTKDSGADGPKDVESPDVHD